MATAFYPRQDSGAPAVAIHLRSRSLAICSPILSHVFDKIHRDRRSGRMPEMISSYSHTELPLQKIETHSGARSGRSLR
jgi:hypothetical protein